MQLNRTSIKVLIVIHVLIVSVVYSDVPEVCSTNGHDAKCDSQNLGVDIDNANTNGHHNLPAAFDSEFIDHDDGGWFTDISAVIAEPGPCNIEIRDASLSQEEFLYRYAKTAPVVLRKTSDNSNFKDVCRKSSILNNHGNKIVRLSSANTYSYDKVDVPLEKYINKIMKPQGLDSLGNETFYWFGDNNYTEWEEVFSAYKPPPYKLPGLTGAYSFGVAGAGTGVPFHFHGPGFAEVIFGLKRWFLYPPEQQPNFNPDKTTLHWLIEDYPKLSAFQKPYECTILPGDAIYFPDHWWHGTLNINTSVFISTFLG